jgi:hypothetical protein
LQKFRLTTFAHFASLSSNANDRYDTTDVVKRVKKLLKGHEDLLDGFNCFLPDVSERRARKRNPFFFRRLLSRSHFGGQVVAGPSIFLLRVFGRAPLTYSRGGKHTIKRERERESPFLLSKREERGLEGKKTGRDFPFFSLFSKNRIEGETRAFLFHEYTTTDTKGLPFSSSSFVLRVDVKTQAYKYGRHAVKSAQVRASKARVLARCCVLRVRVFFLFVFYFGRKKESEHFFSDLFSRNLKK